jgi:hypothetical protein
MRRWLVALVATAAMCVAVPAASAKVVTTTKTFTLKSNSSKIYRLPGGASTVEDAGYVLKGPRVNLREDNLVDPFPMKGKTGLLTKGAVQVTAVGLSATQPATIEVRVKTGKLTGSYTITLYIKNVA